MSVQQIKRGLVIQAPAPEMPDWFRHWLMGLHVKSLHQLDALHSAFQAMPNVAITLAATSAAILFPTPFTPVGYVGYTVMAMPNWNTTTLWVSAKTEVGCTLNFGGAPANATVDILIVN